MKESTTREKVLKKIRKSILQKTKNPYPVLDHESEVFHMGEGPEEIVFAENLTASGGIFIFCESELELIENLIGLAEDRQWAQIFCKDEQIKLILDKYGFPFSEIIAENGLVDASVSSCECLCARTGSVLVSSRQSIGRKGFSYPKAQIMIANTSQLVPDIKDSFAILKAKYETLPSMMTWITGPSRTADIERKLVLGVHGPQELFVFLLEDQLSDKNGE